MKSLFSLAFLVVVLTQVCVSPAAAEVVSKLVAPQTSHWDENALKALLSTPIALFFVMLGASMINGLKQLNMARKSGSTMSLSQYLGYLPDTLATLAGNVIAFIALILMDQLNFAAALGVGYGINSVTDMLPGKRSNALAASTGEAPTHDSPTNKQAGFSLLGMLLLLLSLSIIGILLEGCTTNPAAAVNIACDSGQKNFDAVRCAKSIAETWEVYQKRALDVVSAVTTPSDVKQAVQKAEAASRPPVVSLLQATQQYQAIKAQLAAGTTQADQLAIANQSLTQWISTSLPLVQQFGKSLGL